MRVEDVKIGMKVVPHSKSVGVDLGSSIIMKNALKQDQLYLFVLKQIDINIFSLNNEKEDFGGDHFLASDFEPYVEEIKTENVEFKVGDLVQIRDDLVVGKWYGEIDLIEGMDKEIGKQTEIQKIDDRYYKLKNNNYWWSKEMLKPIHKPISQPVITNNTCSVETTSTTTIKDLNNQIIHTKPEQIETVKTIVNDNCVIVILKDGSKGVSKCGKKDKFKFYLLTNSSNFFALLTCLALR